MPSISGLAGTAGKMLDVGTFLTTDNHGKEVSGMAGSMGGTALGAFLISSGILNVGKSPAISRSSTYRRCKCCIYWLFR